MAAFNLWLIGGRETVQGHFLSVAVSGYDNGVGLIMVLLSAKPKARQQHGCWYLIYLSAIVSSWLVMRGLMLNAQQAAWQTGRVPASNNNVLEGNLERHGTMHSICAQQQCNIWKEMLQTFFAKGPAMQGNYRLSDVFQPPACTRHSEATEAWRRATLRSEAISGFLEAAGATSPKGKSWETLRKGWHWKPSSSRPSKDVHNVTMPGKWMQSIAWAHQDASPRLGSIQHIFLKPCPLKRVVYVVKFELMPLELLHWVEVLGAVFLSWSREAQVACRRRQQVNAQQAAIIFEKQ